MDEGEQEGEGWYYIDNMAGRPAYHEAALKT